MRFLSLVLTLLVIGFTESASAKYVFTLDSERYISEDDYRLCRELSQESFSVDLVVHPNQIFAKVLEANTRNHSRLDLIQQETGKKESDDGYTGNYETRIYLVKFDGVSTEKFGLYFTLRTTVYPNGVEVIRTPLNYLSSKNGDSISCQSLYYKLQK